jgi:ribonuclease VapC
MTSTGCRADGNRQLDDHCALLNEANATAVARVIEAGSQRLLSAANLLEASIVIESRKGEAGGRELDL